MKFGEKQMLSINHFVVHVLRYCLCFFICIFLFVIVFSTEALCAGFVGGDGSKSNPWQIATAEQLDNVRNYMGSLSHFVLVNDIDLDVAPFNSGEGWDPIGHQMQGFAGTLDGQGHKITGLFIDRPNEMLVGLFAITGSSISNLALENVDVTGGRDTGGMVGGVSNALVQDSSIITNSYVTGRVSGRYRVGGLVGTIIEGSVSNSYAEVDVSGTGTIGGLIGINYDSGNVSNSFWDIDVGPATSDGGTGKTTLEMMQQNTFTGWDFSAVWAIDEGESYPYLRKQAEDEPPEIIPYTLGNPSQSGAASQLVRGVNVVSGNYHHFATDMAIPSIGPDFVITRSYNSMRETASKNKWMFNIHSHVYEVAGSEGQRMRVSREDGRWQYFSRTADNLWMAINPGSLDFLARDDNTGAFTLYTQGNLVYRYGSLQPGDQPRARLEAIADRHDNAITFSFDGGGRVNGATDAAGRWYVFERDPDGRLIKITDFAGRSVSYDYDTETEQIIQVTDPRGNKVTYEYPSGGTPVDRSYLSGIRDGRDNRLIAIDYRQNRKVESVTDGLGNSVQFHYGYLPEGDMQHPATLVQMPIDNNSFAVVYDDLGRITQTIDAVNYPDFINNDDYLSTSRQFYDSGTIGELSLPTSILMPRGQSDGRTEDFGIHYSGDGTGNPRIIEDSYHRQVKTDWGEVAGQTNLNPLTRLEMPGGNNPMQFDNFTRAGRPQTITDMEDNAQHRTYDTQGLLAQSTDARGNSTHYSYDDNGNLTRITDAKDNYIEFTYDADGLGRVVASRDPRGHVTEYEYDENGNLTKIIYPGDNGYTRMTYDASDNLESVKNPRGYTTTYVYDILNRPIKERYTVDGQQHIRRFEYDAMGRMYRVINENEDAFVREYTPRSEVFQEINPLSEATTYEYDANGNIIRVTDAEGRFVEYQYDNLDRVERATDALGHYQQYQYNNQGRLSGKRDARGKWTYYEYDNMGRMITVIDPDEEETLAEYDANGNLSRVIDSKGQITRFEYDVLNHVSDLYQGDMHWQFTYDKNGNMETRTTPSGLTTSYTYDSLDRVTAVNYPGGPSVIYTYDANGNRIAMNDGIGMSRYEYDEADRLISYTDAFDNTVEYEYDNIGLLSKLNYPGNRAVDYNYDAAGRLRNLNDWLGHTTNYTRDQSGAITRIDYGNGAWVQKSYDDAGRLTSLINQSGAGNVISRHLLTLDGSGNPTGIEANLPLMPANLGRAGEMLYDSANRMTSIKGAAITHDDDGRMILDQSGTDPIEYAYNAQDLITSVARAGEVTDTYTYDGDGRRVSHTRDGQTRRFVNDPRQGNMYNVLAETDVNDDVLRYYIYGAGLVSQIADGEHHYYHFDQSGNTIALTGANGEMTDAYAYEPFGNTTAQGDTYNPFRFVGRYGVMDDGNGLHHMRARYYRPDLRRFVSMDALLGEVTDPLTLNRYAYVKGNPIRFTDPDGYSAQAQDYATSTLCEGLSRKVPNPVGPFFSIMCSEPELVAETYDALSNINKKRFADYQRTIEAIVDDGQGWRIAEDASKIVEFYKDDYGDFGIRIIDGKLEDAVKAGIVTIKYRYNWGLWSRLWKRDPVGIKSITIYLNKIATGMSGKITIPMED